MIAARPLALALACSLAAAAPAAAETYKSEKATFQVETVAEGLEHPWGMAFLPDGRLLVTERPGRLRIVSLDGTKSPPIEGVPRVFARGQGGLLDVALDPAYAANGLVYLSYAEPGPGGDGTAVARARLDGNRLADLKVIFQQMPKRNAGQHFGSRLVFAPDGKLFITTGDRGKRDEAQNLAVHLGKLIRINSDGSVPDDNPFVGTDDARREIWSYGHRNMQGAALNPETGVLWTIEHGARGGDELNIPQAGKNYGWPVITYGRDYSGLSIGEGTEKPGMEQPIYYWDPSIAPSGMAFYTGDKFPQWRGNLFVGALGFELLARLELDGAKVTHEERLLKDLGERIRDVRQGPDGLIYLLTDSDDGRLLRLSPPVP
jgi:glucose/arabinose dehydrogenase